MTGPRSAVGVGRLLPFPDHPLEADSYLLSFPKCGRTWLRMLMAKAISLQYGLPMDLFEDLRFDVFSRADSRVPKIQVWHDDQPGWRTPDELTHDKSHYRNARVVLLVRDLRDVAVSHYFQRSRRVDNPFRGGIEDYLLDERGSVRTCIEFWNIWYANRNVPAAFLVCSYEDLSADPTRELGSVLRFCGLPDPLPGTVLTEAAEYASFANMRSMEVGDTFATEKLRPADPADPESFKTRRGIVGGFRDYLSPRQIETIDGFILNTLTPELHRFAFAAQAAAGGPSPTLHR